LNFREFYRTTVETFFDQLDQNRVLCVPVIPGELNMPSIQVMYDFGKRSSAPFFIELEIQESSPAQEVINKLSPILFHADYLKVHGQPVWAIRGKNLDQDMFLKFFNNLGYPRPLIIAHENSEPFFVPIHIHNATLIVGDGAQKDDSLMAESFLYVAESKNSALIDLKNNLANRFSEKPYFNSLMESNSKLYGLKMKYLAQAEQIKNLQVYNERLREESKKEIEWHRNELRNYLAWHESTQVSFSNLYRRAKNFLRKLFPF